MANLRAIRKRISSVKNTRQITKAMKLVSGAKLKRATDAAVAARPYNRKLKQLLNNLMEKIDVSQHLLFQEKENVKKIVIIAFSSDRGLCGSYNSSISRQVDSFDKELSGNKVGRVYTTVGRKIRDHVRRKGFELMDEFSSINATQYAAISTDLGKKLVHLFSMNEIDAVYLIYNQFKSAISQVVVTEQLLPITVGASSTRIVSKKNENEETSLVDFIYEPSQKDILDLVLPQMIANHIMQAFLESNASEHGARMAAMDSATRNASEMIDKLTLEYNRARQAAITKELVEIVSGAEAL